MYESSCEFHDIDQTRNSLLQLTIGKLRDWVFSRTEPFTISDIYLDTDVSKDLCVNKEMIKSMRSALLKLGCRVTANSGFNEVFQAPSVKRIHRDLWES